VTTLKHGGHHLNSAVAALSAGSASDTSDVYPYDYLYSTYNVYDPVSEFVSKATLVFAAGVSITATNFFNVVATHRNVAGSTVDQITIFNQSTTAATAYVPIDVTAIAASTGNSFQLGWTLTPGDSIEIKRTSTGTGAASPAFGVNLVIGTPNI
jgi:hypothetical protein